MLSRNSSRIVFAGIALILISSVTFASPWTAALNWLGLESAPVETAPPATAPDALATTVTTNGGSGLAPTYPDLASAITALNAATITSPVVITVSGTETAPAGGYVITATGTAVNTIVIDGGGAGITTITAGLQVAAGTFDAVFKIHGGDFITIQGFTMQENAANIVTTPIASNTMTEFGVLLVHASATDGAQNDTLQNNIITLNSTYTNSVGIFSTSSSSTANASLDATSTAGTNSNNKIYGNTISNVAYGIYFICPPITATVTEGGNDFGGAAAATGNTITFGNAAATSGPWNRSITTAQAGILFRNGAGNSVRFNGITSNSAAYVGSAGLNGIQISSGTAPTGVTYTSTISDNTVNLTTTGIALVTGIDFGHGISTGTIASSNNNITINQNSTAAVSAAIIGLKANYTAATSTLNTNTILINQAFTPAATATNSSPITALSMPGGTTGAPTMTANGNGITINRTSTAGAAITSTMSGTQIGILATTAASTMTIGATGAGNGNALTIKEAVAGAGTNTYTSTVSYMSINAAHGNINIVNDTFNTTTSTIRSTGACDILLGGASTLTGTLTITNNTVNVDRIAASGAVGFYTQTSTSPNDPTDVISNNNITFTNLSGTSTATVINRLGGGTTATRAISNNTISASGATTGTLIGIVSGFAGTTTMSTNSVTLSSAGATVTGITANANNTTALISNSTLSLTSSATAPTAMTGISAAGSGAHSIIGTIFTGMNFTGIITTTPTVSGIVVSGGTGAGVSGNTITNISVGAASSTSSATIDGILISGGTSVNAFKNKIHGITTAATGTATVVNGIRISSGTTNTVSNNLIGNLSAGAASSTDALRGISITSATASSTQNIYYNSIFLSGSGGANFGSSGIFHTISTTSTTSALNLRNNIIVNTATPSGTGLTVAYRRSGGAASNLANYASTSNNNDFYAGTPGVANLIYSDGTSSAQTIGAYKSGVFTAGTIAPRDAASFSELPPFLSTTGSNANFLHISAVIATQAESNGAPIAGITDDFDGNLRNVTTPDIGADEFTGIAIDLTAPAISYTALTSGPAVPTRTFSNVTITDATAVEITAGLRPRVYYKKTSDANNTFNDNTSATVGWKYVEASGGGGSPFSFTIDYSLLFGGGGAVVGDTIQYFVVAQDTVTPTPNVGINAGTFAATPTSVALTASAFPIGGSINAYNIVASISGTKTVCNGGGCDYNSLTNAGGGAFEAINAGILDANLTLNITGDLTGETGAVALNVLANTDTLAKNSGTRRGKSEDKDGEGSNFAPPYGVTIKPSGAPRSITGTGTGGILIKINGADNVTIDGSLAGGTDRSLTLNNPNTATGTGTVFVASLGTGAGSTNDTVKNCIIKAGGIGSTSVFTFAVFVGDTTGAAAGADNDNLTIQNNQIMMARTGIQAVGTAAGVLDNLNINGNLIGDNTPANSIGRVGMTVQVLNNASVSSNTVKNVFFAADTSSAVGIQMVQSTNSTIGFNTVTGISSTGSSVVPQGITAVTTTTGLSINANIVDGVSGSGSVGPQGITVSTGVTNSSVTRNTVTNINYTGTGGYGGKGMEINTGNASSNVTVANNFITNIRGDAFGTGSFTLDTIMGLRVTGATGGVNIYHNSVYLGSGGFASTQTSTASMAFYVASTATALNVRNNIFANNLDNTVDVADKNYAFYSDAANTAFTDINYNDYWVPVSSATGPQVLGFIGSDRLTVGNMQTGTGKDANSISADPLFTSSTDLHIAGGASLSPAAGAGTPIAGLVSDYDSDPRPATAPDMGADELVQAEAGLFPSGTFYNARIVGSSMAGNVTITNTLYLLAIQDVTPFTVTLGCNATVVGAGTNSYLIGNVKKDFCSAGSFSMPVGTTPDNALADGNNVSPEGNPPEYTPLDLTVTAGTFPSSLTVSVTDDFLPGVVQTNAASRYWTITETGDLTVDMTFHYLDAPFDVNGNESLYQTFKRSGGFTTLVPGSTNNPALNTVSITGVTSFSDWGLANAIPTAAGASISGRVTTAGGNGIRNAMVILTGNSLPQPIVVQTGSFGVYSFDNLRVGETYVLQVGAKRFRFSNPTRVITLDDSVADLDFTANPQE